MRTVLYTFSLLLVNTISAQYNNPYRMAFDGANYLVTNKGNGAVTRIDSNSNHTFPITGLSSPNDIVVRSFLGTQSILIIDNNQVKIFQASNYSSVTQIAIQGATEAHDIVFHPSDPNIFFISDRAGGKILKATIGPAPLYSISYSILTSSVIRPAGMIMNNDGKLVVVSDTIDAAIYTVNIANGSTATKWTNYDNLNDIAQDAQNNYYITCWGDDNLYRLSDSLNSPYTVSTFNNPSGLLNLPQYDLLGICCYNCQKIEFKFFHLFSPMSDIITCTQDSFFVDFVPAYQGIGTYEVNNVFRVELTDTQGNFPDVPIIGMDSTQIRPTSISCFIDPALVQEGAYRYRIVSTHPPVVSYFDKALTIRRSPYLNNVPSGNYAFCGDTLQLGDTGNAFTRYTWSPGNTFTDSTASLTKYIALLDQQQVTLNMVDVQTQCDVTLLTDLRSVKIMYTAMDDTSAVCSGDTITLGNEQNRELIFNWQDSSLSDTQGITTRFFSRTSQMVRVNIQDSNHICSVNDSTFVKIYPLPEYEFTTMEITACKGDTISLTRDTVQGFVFESTANWPFPIIDSSAQRVRHRGDTAGNFPWNTNVRDINTGCDRDYSRNLRILDVLDSIGIEATSSYIQATPFPAVSGDHFRWLINGTAMAHNGDTIDGHRLARFDTVEVEWVHPEYCVLRSDTLVWTKDLSSFYYPENDDQLVYPNPAANSVHFDPVITHGEVKLYDVQGKLLQRLNSPVSALNVSGLSNGSYYLEITVDNASRRLKLLIQH